MLENRDRAIDLPTVNGPQRRLFVYSNRAPQCRGPC